MRCLIFLIVFGRKLCEVGIVWVCICDFGILELVSEFDYLEFLEIVEFLVELMFKCCCFVDIMLLCELFVFVWLWIGFVVLGIGV